MTETAVWPPADLDLTKAYNLKNPVLQAGYPSVRLRDNSKEYTLELVNYPKPQLDAFEEVMHYLQSTGFKNYLRVIPDVNGKLHVTGKRGSYILWEYVPGRVADFSNYDDLIICAKTLGQLHKESKGHFTVGTDWQGYWQESLQRQKSYIHSRDKFSGESEQLFPLLLAAAQKTLDLIKDEEVFLSLWQAPSLCHCFLSSESFLITDQKLALLRGFEHAAPDIPPRDLAELLRQVLIETRGNEDLALKVMAAYFHEFPLSTGDLGLSMAFLYFPRSLGEQDSTPDVQVPSKIGVTPESIKAELILLKSVDRLAKSLGF